MPQRQLRKWSNMREKKQFVFVVSFFIIVVASFIVAAMYGRRTKNSYIDDTDFNQYLAQKDLKVFYHYYPFDENYDIYGSGDNIQSEEDVEKSADVIVKARVGKDAKRKIYTECVLSDIEVLDTYKGDIKSGEIIPVFEPINCTESKGAIYCSEGYSPIRSGEEYILFLKKVKNAGFGKDDYVYIISHPTYSKYELNDKKAKLFQEDEFYDVGVFYQKSKENEVFLYDKEMYNRFYEIKEQVIKKLVKES